MVIAKKFEDLPICLSVDQVSQILGVSRKVAYAIVKKQKLAVRVGQKRLIVPKNRLLEFLEKGTLL